MANIMVNEACNLRCPYCFAEEFVNKAPKEMTLEDFKKALEFVLSDDSDRQVGIIGGEPLLYTHLDKAMRMALSHPRSEFVMIYTNAVELDRMASDILEAKKFRMLVNCNSPEDMGEKAFDKMRQNLLAFYHDHYGAGRFRLSINMYKPDFDYSYVIPLVHELGLDVIRLSISVPQKGELGGMTPLEYFRLMKPNAIKFVGDMIRNGVITGFDCNFIPDCVFTDEEREGMMSAKDVLYNALSDRFSETFWPRVIYSELNNCTPVIDILPDLQAIRCFGLSEYTKQDIRNFSNINELRNYYIRTVDVKACGVWTQEQCAGCYAREIGDCSGGCLLFKAKLLADKY